MNNYKVINNYRNNDELRASFNELAKKTFGINFEDWYQNGYWTDRYNPYSIVLDGKVVANVSVNQTDFEWNGETKHFIQLGTVMTYIEYRNRGLIRRIMEVIDAEYKDKVEGMYLFAGNDVLDFYPKFGFIPIKQYEYVKEISSNVESLEKDTGNVKKVDMTDLKLRDKLECLIKTGYKYSSFEMVDNSQLNMFYLTKFMRNSVYYCETCDAYVVAEIENSKLTIDMVISEKEQNLNHIAECFGQDVQSVVLGFTPKNTDGFSVREMNQDDRTMHVKGCGWEEFETSKLMVPLLAHA